MHEEAHAIVTSSTETSPHASAFRRARPKSSSKVKLAPLASKPPPGDLVMVDVERDLSAGPAVFSVYLDVEDASRPASVQAAGSCSVDGSTMPIRCGIPLSQLTDSLSPPIVALRCWEILARSSVIDPNVNSWLPNVSSARIQSLSGGTVSLAVMAAAEVFADNIQDVASTVTGAVDVRACAVTLGW